MSASISELYFSEDELLAFLGKKNRATLRRWRRAGKGPAYVRLGHLIYYRKEAVYQWLAAQEQGGDPRVRMAA